jgi:hypothetical protein
MGFVSHVAQRESEDAQRTRRWIKATVETIDAAIAVCELHAGKLDSSAADTPQELEYGAFVLWQRRAKAELHGSRTTHTQGLEDNS